MSKFQHFQLQNFLWTRKRTTKTFPLNKEDNNQNHKICIQWGYDILKAKNCHPHSNRRRRQTLPYIVLVQKNRNDLNSLDHGIQTNAMLHWNWKRVFIGVSAGAITFLIFDATQEYALHLTANKSVVIVDRTDICIGVIPVIHDCVNADANNHLYLNFDTPSHWVARYQ